MNFIGVIFTFSAIFVLIPSQMGQAVEIAASDKKIVCPMLTRAELSAYDIPFKLERVDWKLCTHVISADESGEDDAWDLRSDKTQEELVNLRNRYPHLKISLNVRRNLSEYLPIATESTQQGIIEKLHKFITTHKFDGINLQLDHFEDSNITPEQFENVVSFMSALKSRFDQSNLLLTVSIAISDRFDFKYFNLSALSNAVEFITFVQNSGPITNAFSLNDAKHSLSSIEYKIDSLIESNVSPGKIVMSLDFMGYGFTATSDENDEDGVFDRTYRYNEVSGLQLSDPRRWQQNNADTSLLVLRNNEESRTIIIDSCRSIANKVRLALKLGLAGVAPISIAFDEFYGLRKIDLNTYENFELAEGVELSFPQPTERKFPLMNTIKEVTRITLDEIKQESNLPVAPLRVRSTPPPPRATTTTTTSDTDEKPEIYTYPDSVKTVSPEDARVVCQVYTQSDLDAKKIQFDYKKFDWNLCTHVISVEEVTGDPWNSKNEHQSRDFMQLTGLKQKYKFPHLKVSLGVRYKINTYIYMASNALYQKEVVDKFYNFISSHNFDGINFQIEELELGNIRPHQFNQIVAFLSTLQKKFDESNFMVTASILISGRFDYNIYNLAGLSRAVEFVNFVFDYKKTAGVYQMDDAIKAFELPTDQERVEKLIEAGALPEKFVMGIHFTGPAFRMTQSNKDEDAKFYKTYSYGPICRAQIDQPDNWDKSYGRSGVSVLRKKGGLNKMTLILEDTRSVANKVQFAMKRGLGGIAPIFIFADDGQDKCPIDANTFEDIKPIKATPKRTSSTYPLLRTIVETIEMTLGGKPGSKNAVQKTPVEAKPVEKPTAPVKKPPTPVQKPPTPPKTAPKPTNPTIRRKPTQKTTPRKATDRKVVCQVSTQSNLDAKNMDFDLRTVDWNLCTHVVSVDETGGDPWDSKNPNQGRDHMQLTSLKQKFKFPHLKVFLGVRNKLNRYVYMASTGDDYQKEIIEKYHDFVLENQFDGINLQLEDVDLSKIRPLEFNKVVSFITELKKTLDESDIMLSVTIVITGHFNYNIYNLSGLSQSVEFINIVFDYKRTAGDYRLSDAIKSLEFSTDQDRIEKLIESGVPAEKIIMGVHLTGPAFGLTHTQKDEDAKFYNTFGYGPICKALTNQPDNWQKLYGPSGVSVVRKTGGSKRFVVALENSRSIANKVRFAIKRGLAGIAPIYIPFDDVNGDCGIDDDTFSDFMSDDGDDLTIPERTDPTFNLLRTINVAIDVTLNEQRKV